MTGILKHSNAYYSFLISRYCFVRHYKKVFTSLFSFTQFFQLNNWLAQVIQAQEEIHNVGLLCYREPRAQGANVMILVELERNYSQMRSAIMKKF